jgi:hypothetical protein
MYRPLERKKKVEENNNLNPIGIVRRSKIREREGKKKKNDDMHVTCSCG